MDAAQWNAWFFYALAVTLVLMLFAVFAQFTLHEDREKLRREREKFEQEKKEFRLGRRL